MTASEPTGGVVTARPWWRKALVPGTILLVLTAVLVVGTHRTSTPPTPSGDPVGVVGVVPGLGLPPTPTGAPTLTVAPSATPAPTATPLPVVAPVAVVGPDLAQDPALASDLIVQAASRAIDGYFYSDSRETPPSRTARLQPLFVAGARAVSDPPLFTPPPGTASATGATISFVQPAGGATATASTLTIGVQWSLAYWTPGRATTTYGGELVLTVRVVHVDGAWVVESITRSGH
jgi:hypothetical protein